MKTKSILIVLLIAAVLISCGDVKNQVFAQKNDTVIVNEPITNYNVQRYFDENGNQIGYDSVYTYSYSYSGNGEMPEDVQKMMEQFNNFSMSFGNSMMFPNQNPGNQFFNDDFFNNFFYPSPLLNDPNFDKNPNNQSYNYSLEQIIQQHQQQMKQMQQLMDSIYNQQNQINRQEQYNNQKTNNNSSNQKIFNI